MQAMQTWHELNYKLKNGSASKPLSKPCLDLIMFISIEHVIFIFQLFLLVFVMLLKCKEGDNK